MICKKHDSLHTCTEVLAWDVFTKGNLVLKYRYISIHAQTHLSLPLTHEWYFSLFMSPSVYSRTVNATHSLLNWLSSSLVADVQMFASFCKYVGESVYHHLAQALSCHPQFYVVAFIWFKILVSFWDYTAKYQQHISDTDMSKCTDLPTHAAHYTHLEVFLNLGTH